MKTASAAVLRQSSSDVEFLPNQTKMTSRGQLSDTNQIDHNTRVISSFALSI